MAAMAAVTLTLIGFFSFLMIRMTTPQMVPLFTDLSLDDSASVAKDLDRQGVTYSFKNDGTIILVPKDQVARLLTLVPYLHSRGEVSLGEAAQ